LVARRHAVTVACTNFAGKHQKLFPETRRVHYDGVDVVYFNAHRLIPLGLHSFGLFFCPGMIGFLRRELKNYDIVHLDGYRGFVVLVVAHFCRKYKVPYVIQGRGAMKPAHSSLLAKHTYDWLLGRSILKECALFIASSRAEVSDYDGYIRKDQKVVVIPNGLDVGAYANLPHKGEFRKQYRIAETRVITYLGRVHSQKGLDHLLRAFAGSRFRPESRLVIIGPDDGYRTSLAALAQHLDLASSVTFVEALEGRQKLQAYVDSDVVVYAGSSESFGMVPFEAAMCGVPTITSEGSACAQLLTGYGAAFVAPYGDAPKLSQAIDGILENRQEAARKASAARRRIEADLGWEKIAQQYEAAYAEALCAEERSPASSGASE
jgi:glycosyltransferase involved in cell wall biosynthesis